MFKAITWTPAQLAAMDANAPKVVELFNNIPPLPPLVGSPKQVEWANTIRADYIAYWIKLLKDPAFRTNTVNYKRDHVDALTLILAETSAKVWIDNMRCMSNVVTTLSDKIWRSIK